MKHDVSEAQIGWWFAECCECGLYEIKSDEDLQYCRDRHADEVAEPCGIFLGVWPTEAEALADLIPI